MQKKQNKLHKVLRPHHPSARFHIEIDGTASGVSFLVSGIVGIGEFSPERIKLVARYGSLILSGHDMGIMLYEGGNVELSGDIADIQLKYIRRRSNDSEA